jgi:hypothetical protein
MFHLHDRFKTGPWLPTTQQAQAVLNDPEIGLQEESKFPDLSN